MEKIIVVSGGYDPRICKRCGKSFIPHKWNHYYCGKKTEKYTCSWMRSNSDRQKRRRENKEYRKRCNEYQKEWKKKQRKDNTEYAEKQRKIKREYYHTPHGKETSRKWRKENIDKILFWNKRRVNNKKGSFGKFTYEEWNKLKEKFNNCCAICGIHETELVNKYKDRRFQNLTADHIIPIIHGGQNVISNIQPLCIGCNARKRDKVPAKVI